MHVASQAVFSGDVRWQKVDGIQHFVAPIQHVQVYIADVLGRHVWRVGYILALHHHAHRHAEPKSVSVHGQLPVALCLIPVLQTVLDWVHGRSSGLVPHTPETMAHGIVDTQLRVHRRLCVCCSA